MKKLFATLFFATLFLVVSPTHAADPDSGKEVSKQCVSCHGEDGNSPTPNFPRLAGQHQDYLLHALKAYKTGERKNAIMVGIVAALSEDDMKNVAAYYSIQSGLGKIDLPIEASK